MINTIANKIVTALNTLTGSSGKLKKVFSYLEPTPQEFPCAMVDVYTDDMSEKLSTAENMLRIKFLIHVELQGKNSQTSAELRRDIFEDVLKLLSETPYVDDIDGTCVIASFDRVTVWNDGEGESPKIGFDIVLVCQVPNAI